MLYFFPPVVEKVKLGAKDAPPTLTHEYDLVKLVALSLIVGSAGPAFLSTAQSRLNSALNAQKAENAVETGKTQVAQVSESAKAAVPGAVQEAVSQHIPSADADTVKAVAAATTASLMSSLEPQVQVARDQIELGAEAAKPAT